ncbi:MAG: M15 family metallopeptidase [Actinomycetota bacterium]
MRRVAATILLAAFIPVSCTSGPGNGAAREAAPGTPAPLGATPEPTVTAGTSPEAPAPEDARPRFAGRISKVPGSLLREMRGTTWKPGCPVPLADLRLLRFNYWGFDGEVGRGPMVVHEDVAADVLWVFGRLFKARFPIKRVALTREFVPEEFEPRISSPRSVTASFNCRPVITPLGPGEDFSQHSYGLAIDINPVQNPFVTTGGFVRNRMARPYLDRGRRLTGMIHDGDVVVRSFAAVGWSWGGHWSGGKDYMHFSRSGG